MNIYSFKVYKFLPYEKHASPACRYVNTKWWLGPLARGTMGTLGFCTVCNQMFVVGAERNQVVYDIVVISKTIVDEVMKMIKVNVEGKSISFWPFVV